MNLTTLLRTSVVAAALALAAPLPTAPIRQAAAQSVDVDVSIFFDDLEPHGRWIETTRYGYVFVPAGTGPDWAPYTDGHWEYTDEYGWVWVSDEPHGWATYHYGRWGYDDDTGWFWVPGSEWAPAWVSWQASDDDAYIGWAPLSPVGSGYSIGLSIGPVSIGIGAWRFVEMRHFLEPSLRVHFLAPARNAYWLGRTRRLGTVTVVNRVVVNKVVKVTRIEKVVNRKVVVRNVRPATAAQKTRVADGAIETFKPKIAAKKPTRKPKQVAEVKKLVHKPPTIKAVDRKKVDGGPVGVKKLDKDEPKGAAGAAVTETKKAKKPVSTAVETPKKGADATGPKAKVKKTPVTKKAAPQVKKAPPKAQVTKPAKPPKTINAPAGGVAKKAVPKKQMPKKQVQEVPKKKQQN
ncbi:MAG: DUF6600 domain-containing protein [Pseudomonadota bacterium]